MPALITDAATQDPQDMRAAVRAFPDHLQTGWDAAEATDDLALFLPELPDLNGVVLVGMGGSAIGGDLVRTLAADHSPVPFLVIRDYTLPAWVSARTLVIASSYSGGTEETLAAYAEAEARGARLVVVTSGGDIAEKAAAAGVPTVTIPGGLQPRAALGYSLGAVLRLARALGLLALPDAEFDAAVADARDRAARHDADDDANPARALSEAYVDRLPVVYTAAGFLEAVAMRWRTQLHENAKHPAVGNVFPELDHNEIMGYESGPADLLARMHVEVLRDRDDHPQVQKRYAATRDLVSGDVHGWTEVMTDGESRLARMLSLVQLGDAASYWLAIRKGVDPTPVETIQALKKTLVG
ncbi:MAG TPA: bifunctional phosphoglucose/phosphomannose isomerase [Rubricoccaceae bacterium]|jgi:glucose/mannose-6-phosphate isomerase